jgi:hypothetical protein
MLFRITAWAHERKGGRTPTTARRRHRRSSRAGGFDAVYLRAAQAYMLISMPTGTSTILGAFQVISSSQEFLDANSAPGPNLGPRPPLRKSPRDWFAGHSE